MHQVVWLYLKNSKKWFKVKLDGLVIFLFVF